MRRIIITVPKNKGGKWLLSLKGKRGRGYKTASSAYNAVESSLKSFLEARLGEKTAVRVNYGKGFVNESLTSNQPRYLLYCLACFLEGYLSEFVTKFKYKKYAEGTEDH